MGRTGTDSRGSSPHAQLRLEQRLPPAVAERGYELLRDRGALAQLIASAAREHPALAEGERVALALAPRDPCPHLIATRAGDGVTTLAAGMAHGLPTVPFARVEAFLARRATLLQATIEVRKNLVEDERSPLVRAFLHPHRVTREELERLRKLAPLMGDMLRERIVDAVAIARDAKPPTRPWSERRLDKVWRAYLSGALLLTVDGFECPVGFLLQLTRTPDIALASRAIWHLANRPEETLATIARMNDEGALSPAMKLIGAVHVLPALSTRHPAYHKDARRLSASLAPVAPLMGAGAVRKHLRAELLFPLLIRLPVVIPPPWTDESERTPERKARAVQIAGDLLDRTDELPLHEIAAALSPWHARMIRTLDPLRAISTPPQTRVCPTSSLSEEERLRVTMWRTILWTWPLPIDWSEPFLPVLFALAPLEALAPLDEPDPALSLSNGRRYLTHRLFQMTRLRKLVEEGAQASADDGAAREAPLVSRNAPCLCGSGKKYKRCCGMRP